MEQFLAALLGYALGSVPFGLLLTGLTGAGNLREIGSGNIGATNVLRTGRKGLAAATLLLDLGKALVAVLLAKALFPGLETLAAAGAVIGHCFPVWLKFKGGKGVATLAGAAFGFAWPIGLAYAVVWIGGVVISRISSLGGMAAAIAAPAAAIMLGYPTYAQALAALAVLVLWMHRENIGRLLRGKEPRIGSKS